MSEPHMQESSETKLSYSLSRTRRRWLVMLMLAGTLWTLLWTSPQATGNLLVEMGGMLISFVCYLGLYMTMKEISRESLSNLDERQTMISGRAYRTAFSIVIGCVWISYALYVYGLLDWVNFKTNVPWLLMMATGSPMAVMAWTEPD